ncbi:MAG: hypothetical protein V2I35_10050, partial [Desulfocapsaceae bacterium]|nr:hypothetical protein [Desulfocapsaceae bacterium]
REQQDLQTFSLLRSDTPVVTDFESSILQEQQSHLLSDEVVELDITYIGHDGEEYKEWNSVSDFDEEQDVHKRYPHAYKIVLRLGTGENDDASVRYQTSVPVFAALYEFAGDQ